MNWGLRSRSSAGYPGTAISGKDTMSAPSSRAFSMYCRTFAVLPVRSPTVLFICAMAILSTRTRVHPSFLVNGAFARSIACPLGHVNVGCNSNLFLISYSHYLAILRCCLCGKGAFIGGKSRFRRYKQDTGAGGCPRHL